MTIPKALIFDLNGTMINDMEFHTRAWQQLFNNDLGANLSWADVKKEMYGKNQEVLVRVFGPDRFTQAEMDELSIEKERGYQKEFLPHLALLPGLKELLDAAYERNIPMAIGSAAIPFNINFVLDNLNLQHYFKAIVSADDVKLSKPHPETFLNAASLLQVNPTDCLVFEDTPKGAETAMNANMKCVVLTTTHQAGEFSYLDNIVHYAADYTGEYFKTLLG
ncbi:HAD family hydrolase [Mucilaginibacter sp. X5P1]|uniref:HAD family hydrolase n=1 Tax=Mucilaginibacter sp. X5P1 TaxID=2723088 RepID=UPI001610A685|nr:HAD family phosphatase [Mucilaginibacter sp. X5P1]MBB6137829.1 beta-phosphoglucomutase family hydrolase [Mucilaginibacter sp. X5P1]